MANSSDWLDKHIEEQKMIHQQTLGDINIVSKVASDLEVYGDDFFDNGECNVS